jgi:hypothetical protein
MRTHRERISVGSCLHVCRTTPQHGTLHRRFQIALVIYRYKKTWKSPMVKALVTKYGADEC